MSNKVLTIGSAGAAGGLITISGATNATPIVITLGAGHGLKNGDRIAIAGVTGNTNANGEWTLASVGATTATLVGSVGNGVFGGTPRVATIFDATPGMRNHSAALHLWGNGVATLLLEAFESYAEFAAGNNAQLGIVPAPVLSPGLPGITNTSASAASSSTVASSSIVVAATNQGMVMEMKMPRYLRASLSAYTSGTLGVSVEA
ncbi:hypothetical protein [Roseateles depolymerans]|uniref:Uncharacterized protein n=1 Tax=Roseateles depolymerans TaxID=76731 RepID=A0A0U3E0P1_9BURK|nr:hypothetical protein [Roseateles depolymerans]ALV06693.1 hypothetical protein RD2015_2221 [Roseateles depolymerans]REG19670.1 hypothetical protein DES44_2170 [Roseateles depolymerans]